MSTPNCNQDQCEDCQDDGECHHWTAGHEAITKVTWEPDEPLSPAYVPCVMCNAYTATFNPLRVATCWDCLK
tara:strand:+ start:203 stop:418 length:216 start_codon:yes stop_codon:yes gene_type:complete